MSATVINTLKNRIAYMESEGENLARAIDSVAARLADALERLRPHDPDYVRQALGENPNADEAADDPIAAQ